MDPRYPPPPPRYVMLKNEESLRPPPNRRNLPPYDSPRGRAGGGGGGGCSCCCCRCMCWFCCFLLLFVLAIAGAAVYFLLVDVSPKAPSYSIDELSVGDFDIHHKDLTLYIKVVASVRAENPNDMIGIYYGNGSKVVLAYRDVTLCQGQIPSFFQGHRNKTIIPVVLEGRHGFDQDLQKALKEDKKAKRIPIDIYVRVPVALRLDDLDLGEMIANVSCSLVVDNLSPNAKIDIKSAQYKVDVDI